MVGQRKLPDKLMFPPTFRLVGLLRVSKHMLGEGAATLVPHYSSLSAKAFFQDFRSYGVEKAIIPNEAYFLFEECYLHVHILGAYFSCWGNIGACA